MSNRIIPLSMLCLLVLLGACSADPGPGDGSREQAPAQVSKESRGIQWFGGTVEEAFAAAAEQDKPIFLYYGAEWCPYCKELQATVFIRDRFVELSRQFIAINLGVDDTDKIQYGDRFKVYGLPTVIVFNPRGQEITRIAGGMDTQHYAGVLALTLNSIRPVAELVSSLQAGQAISDDDWRLLGAYSWFQDKGQVIGEQDLQTVLHALAAACPQRLALARSRLQLAALGAWLEGEERDPAFAGQYHQQLMGILADETLAVEQVVTLSEIAGQAVRSLTTGEEQSALRVALLDNFTAVVDAQEINVLTRSYALAGWAAAATALLPEEAGPSADQLAWVKAETASALAELGPFEQHAGINTLWHVYYELGLEQEARDTLVHGIEVSRTPYYFMSSLAYIERKAGNNDLALEWYRRAWEAATGPTTRVRWGMGYVARLIDLAPSDVERIDRASAELLSDVSRQPGWLSHYQGSFDRLSDKLLAWSGEEDALDRVAREQVIARLRARMNSLCGASAGGEVARVTCDGFLAAPSTQPG